MSTAPRKQAARLPRPAARYWKGKAPKGVDALPSDSDDDDDDGQQVQEGEEGDVMIGGVGVEEDEDEDDLEVREVKKVATKKGMNVTLKDVKVSKEGKVMVAGREEVGKTLIEQEQEEEEEEEEEEEGEEEGVRRHSVSGYTE